MSQPLVDWIDGWVEHATDTFVNWIEGWVQHAKEALPADYLKYVFVPLGTLAFLSAFRSYQTWMSLGPGGIPHSVFGWILSELLLRPFSLWDVREIKDLRQAGNGYLKAIDDRTRDPPRVKGHAPNRQINYFSPRAIIAEMESFILNKIPEKCPRRMHIDESYLGRAGSALFVTNPVEHCKKYKGECAQIHSTKDGSLHVVLHPLDAIKVMEGGWGERHPLAKGLFLPRSYILLYAPQDNTEVETVKKIVRAAVNYVGGGLQV